MITRRTASTIAAACLVAGLTACSSSTPSATSSATSTTAAPTVQAARDVPALAGYGVLQEARGATTSVMTDGVRMVTLAEDAAEQTAVLTAYGAGTVPSTGRSALATESPTGVAHAEASASTQATATAASPASHDASPDTTDASPEEPSAASSNVPLPVARPAAGAMWAMDLQGLTACAGTSVIFCEVSSLTAGVQKAEAAYAIEPATGEVHTIAVGREGTYMFVGAQDDQAFFLTWDGTDNVHVTGFDSRGVPVADRNVRMSVPSRPREAITASLSGGYVAIRSAGGSGVYSIATNTYVPVDISGTCVGLSDGVACESATGVAVVSTRGKHDLETPVRVAESDAATSAKAADVVAAIDRAATGILVIEGSTPAVVPETGSVTLPSGAVIDLGSAYLTGASVTKGTGHLTVALRSGAPGTGPTVRYSILLRSGEVTYSPTSATMRAALEDLHAGSVAEAGVLTSSGKALVYQGLDAAGIYIPAT